MFQHKLSNLFKCGALLLSILCLSQQSVLSQCTFSASVQGSAGATTKYYLTNLSGVVVDDTAPLTAPSVGDYRLYAVTHDAGTTGFPAVGQNVSGINGGCFTIDFIPAICRCSSTTTSVSVSTSGYETNYTQSYALMSGSTISAVNTTGTFTAAQLSTAGLSASASVKIYAINHDATAAPTVGQALPTLGCSDADSYALISAYSCCAANAGTWIN